MKQKNFTRKSTQRGYALLVVAAILVAVAGLGFIVVGSLTATELIRAGEMKQEAFVQSTSYMVRRPAGDAMNVHAHFLSNILQLQLNKKTGKGTDVTLDSLHDFCKSKFPLYQPMEFRGATVANISDQPGDPFVGWRYLYGHGVIKIRYDGTVPITKVPGNTLDPTEFPWAISLTYTFPYTIERCWDEVPEDGAQNDLGGMWRFPRPVSTWGTKGGTGKTDAGAPGDSVMHPPKVIARYENAIEMHCYIAIAKQDVNEPFNGDLIGIISEPPTGCNPNEPVQVIHESDGSCRVGNCATFVAHNFQNCSDDPNQDGSPAKFAEQYNRGLLDAGKVKDWIGQSVQFLHDRNDRIGTKLIHDRFTPTIIGQIPQPLIPNGSSLLKTQLLVEKPKPILAQHWVY